MSQENKELLLVDLSARLPYGLYATVRDPEENDDFQPFEVLGIKEDLVWVRNTMIGVDHFDTIEVVKPYLRPMSSMTEEEWEELNCIGHIVPLYDGCFGVDMRAYLKNNQPHYRRFSEFSTIEDWFNAHHFDYRGLIDKGLALEAQEGMYNIKEHNKI